MIPSIEELKGQCKIDLDDNSEDSLLTLYGTAAKEKAEKFLNMQLFDSEVPDDVDNGMVINASVKLAIMLAVGHWYENREDSTELNLSAIPLGFNSLLRDYRRGPGT